MSLLSRSLGISLAILALTSHLRAQDEAHLRKALEGKRVTLQIDMPATAAGVDIFPGTSRPLNFEKYANRLKENGTSIKVGEAILITKVKVKDELIEIHLGGGGYGTFGDALNSWATNQGADSGMAQQARIANQRTQAVAAGSRFNLHFPNGVTPEELTASSVVQALREYVAFPPALTEEPVAAASPASRPAASDGAAPGAQITARKGMSLEDLERVAGKPISSKTNGQVVTNRYKWQDGVLEADFFNGILVAYRISST